MTTPIHVTHELDTGPNVMSVTKSCYHCHGTSTFVVSPIKLSRWQQGSFIQNVWPDATPDQREGLISGFHGACFDEVFGDQ